jgi:hypothetical protein
MVKWKQYGKQKQAYNLVILLNEEAYKGENAQTDTVRIILEMIGKKVSLHLQRALLTEFARPDSPLPEAFKQAASE